MSEILRYSKIVFHLFFLMLIFVTLPNCSNEKNSKEKLVDEIIAKSWGQFEEPYEKYSFKKDNSMMVEWESKRHVTVFVKENDRAWGSWKLNDGLDAIIVTYHPGNTTRSGTETLFINEEDGYNILVGRRGIKYYRLSENYYFD